MQRDKFQKNKNSIILGVKKQTFSLKMLSLVLGASYTVVDLFQGPGRGRLSLYRL